MKTLLLILLGLVPCCAFAQGGTIAGAEYFVNADPGAGQATPISPADGSFDNALEQIEFDLDTASLTHGAHTVYLRFQDDNGQWGRPRSAAVQIVLPPDELIINVAAAEYYIDLDPGQGQATAISGDFASDAVTAEFTLPTEGLPSGLHVAYIRFQDENGQWGRPKSAVFEVSIALQDLQINLATAEYFIDQDSGNGQAIAISGSFSGQTSEIEYNIDTAGLTPGSHVAYTRFQDADGQWGRPKSAAFQISIPAEDLIINVVAAEYFIDQDPGEGQATTISGDFSGDTVTADFDIDTSGLPPGSHVAYIRFQDQDGQWGRLKSAAFQISTPAEDLIINITGAEYFIDQDPGQGQATALEAEDGVFDSATDIASLDINTDGLAEGRHVAYVRFQDENGVWGRPSGDFFNVRTTPVGGEDAEFNIVAAEYFIDSDPGQSSGTPLEPVEGDFAAP
jgi:hypothetical protein